MLIEETLDKIYGAVIENRLLQLFTVFTRGILAFGFFPPGLKKVLHQPFTILPDSNPVGHYFNALYHTGFYYEFIGWAQVIAAILLIFPRTAHLGALIFFPIILNIAVLTNAVGFAGTWLLTIFMFLASLYLVCWNYDRIKPIFFTGRGVKITLFAYELIWLPIIGAIGGITVGIIFYSIKLGNFSNYFNVSLMLSAAGFVFGIFMAIHHRFMSVGNLKKSSEFI